MSSGPRAGNTPAVAWSQASGSWTTSPGKTLDSLTSSSRTLYRTWLCPTTDSDPTSFKAPERHTGACSLPSRTLCKSGAPPCPELERVSSSQRNTQNSSRPRPTDPAVRALGRPIKPTFINATRPVPIRRSPVFWGLREGGADPETWKSASDLERGWPQTAPRAGVPGAEGRMGGRKSGSPRGRQVQWGAQKVRRAGKSLCSNPVTSRTTRA